MSIIDGDLARALICIKAHRIGGDNKWHGAMPKFMTRDIETLVTEYRKLLERQSDLCSRVEAVADSLPGNCNVQECLNLASGLGPTVKIAHKFEEELIFPVLRSTSRVGEADSTLRRLGQEHMIDEDFADDLATALRDYVVGDKRTNAETLAWMLRAFFEPMRRHLAFERDHVLPLLVDKKPIAPAKI